MLIMIEPGGDGMITTLRDLTAGLNELGLDANRPVLVHASLSAFGSVRGGPQVVLAALLRAFHTVLAPTFTYRCLVTPETGPPDNAAAYGSARDQNSQAEFFRMDLPADPAMGVIAETLRQAAHAQRSPHPLLSFAGINAGKYLRAQSLAEPLAVIDSLAWDGGWVLLLGVNHTVNTSIHHAERLAGRRQFTRWALTYQGVMQCPRWPGCSNGFNKASHHLQPLTRSVTIGGAEVRAVPLRPMLNLLVDVIRADPLALLCADPHCERCQAVRSHVLNSLTEEGVGER